MINVTADQVKSFSSKLTTSQAQSIADAANAAMAKYSINTTALRVRHFMAQAAAETQGFTKWEEVLVYSYPDRLPVVWPTRFYFKGKDRNGKYVDIGRGPRNAVDYAGKPEKLANAVYGGREGNGDEASGDGWKYRGRGGNHLTFRNNYTQASKDIYGDSKLVDNPDLVAQYPDGMLTAAWYWSVNKILPLADKDDFSAVTKAINRPSDADLPRVVAERKSWMDIAKAVFV